MSTLSSTVRQAISGLSETRMNKSRADLVMQNGGVDVILALKPQNVFYSTGFPSLLNDVIPLWGVVAEAYPQISIIPKSTDQALVASVASARDARIHSWVKDYRGYGPRDDAFELIRGALAERGVADGVIALEQSTPHWFHTQLKEALPGAKFEFVADKLLGDVKMIKSAEEIRRLRKACDITQKAMMEVMENTREGVIIAELIQLAKARIVQEGGTGWYHTNVWSERAKGEDQGYLSVLRRGDLLSLDIGAIYYGYTGDLRRSVFVGMEPPANVRRIHDVECEALDAIMDAIRPGVEIREIYRVAHEILRKGGYEGRFGWHVGHSIGVEVEEEPRILEGGMERFEPNMVFCVELFYAVEPYTTFGVGIEETGVITERGFEKFTTLERNIYVA